MSILSGKSICVRCTHDITNKDMAGDTCIECLNELERIKGREEKNRVIAECCAECRASDKPGLVYPIPFCEDGCCATRRELKLLEMEK